MTKLLRYTIIIVLLSGFASCMTSTRKASKGSSSYYETFFIDNSTTQYFIKPLDFNNVQEVEIDFTFRKTHSTYTDVTMNFSYIRESKNNNSVENISLSCNDSLLLVNINNMMYKELKNKKYIYRYNATINFENLNAFFTSTDQALTINGETLLPTKRSKKKLSEIKSTLFEFELED